MLETRGQVPGRSVEYYGVAVVRKNGRRHRESQAACVDARSARETLGKSKGGGNGRSYTKRS